MKVLSMRSMLIVLLPFIVGCGSSRYLITEYTLNQPITVTVGSRMIRWGQGNELSFPLSKEGIAMELIYGGIDHNVILVTYREYNITDDLNVIRPAFSQELRYDLAKSRQITFQDARILVDTADQASLSFTVLKGPLSVPDVPVAKRSDAPVGFTRLGFYFDKWGIVREVVKKSPADSAGVLVDDAIFEINDDPIPKGNLNTIHEMLDKPGHDWLRLRIHRGDFVTQLDIRNP